MQKPHAPPPKPPKPYTPSPQALRRALASSTALETGQSVQALEQKLQHQRLHRFAHIQLAD